jgi:2-deoxy-D-gluconate 3-dehydrogenase
LENDPVRGKDIMARIPAQRWGKPEDLGGPAVFLASRASDYIHGEILLVDGGWMGKYLKYRLLKIYSSFFFFTHPFLH